MNHFRTALENYIEIGNSDFKDELRKGINAEVLRLSDSEWPHYSYALSGSQKEFLNNVGIPLHPNGCLPHPHPASKTIENFFLFGIVAPLIRERFSNLGEKFGCLSMKHSKFIKLQNKVKSESLIMNLVNRIIDSKDVIRYGSHWPKVDTASNSNLYLKKHFHRGNIFMHDEIHHWSLDDLVRFLDVVKPKNFLATAVFPPEAYFGSLISLNPHLYEYEIKGRRLIYFPDGNSDGKYEQPADFPLIHLQTIQVGRLNYSITFLNTIGSHHLIHIQEGLSSLERYRYFNGFTHFNPTIDKTIFLKPVRVRLNSVKLKKMVLYLMSLKKPDRESAVAKLRQLSGDEIDEFELPFVAELATLIMTKKIQFDEMSLGLINTAIDKVFGLNRWMRNLIPSYHSRNLMRKMQNGFKHNFCIDLLAGEVLQADDDFDLPTELTDQWSDGIKRIEERISCPYSSEIYHGVTECIIRRETLIGFHSEHPKTDLSDDLHRMRAFYCFNYQRCLDRGLPEPLKICWIEEVPSFEASPIFPLCLELGPLCKRVDSAFHFALPKYFSNLKKKSSHFLNSTEDGKSGSVCPLESEDDSRSINSEDLGFGSDNEEAAPIENQRVAKLLDSLKSGEFKGKENFCFIDTVSEILGFPGDQLLVFLITVNPEYWVDFVQGDMGADEVTFQMFHLDRKVNLLVWLDGKRRTYGSDPNYPTVEIVAEKGHIAAPLRKNGDGSKLSVIKNVSVKNSFEDEILSLKNCSDFILKVNSSDANHLRTLFRSRKEGVLLDSTKTDFLSESFKPFDLEIKAHFISGLPGSGKSFACNNFYKSNNDSGNVAVVSPRKELKKEWGGDHCFTFETFLMNHHLKYEIVIIDEVFLLPNGYLDLLIGQYLLKKGRFDQTFCLIGDPLQAKFHSKSDCSNIPALLSKMVFSELNYLNFTRRLGSWAQTLFPFPCLGNSQAWSCHLKTYGSMTSMMASIPKEERPDLILVASQEDKRFVPETSGFKVLTFGESQGITVCKAAIVLSGHSSLCSDSHWFVALTRAREGFCFLNYYDGGIDRFKCKSRDSIIGRVLNGIPITYGFLEGMMSLQGINSINWIDFNSFGNTFAEEKLQGDPWLKPYLFLGQVSEAEICTYFEPKAAEEVLKTHLPIAEENLDFAEMFDSLKAKEFREFKVPYDMSAQFIDSSFDDQTRACQPLTFEAIYPRHKADDEVTFWAAVKKRLRFSKPEIEKFKYEQNFLKGKAMFENFLKFVPIDNEFRIDLLEGAQNDFEMAKLKKDAATIENHSLRSCADWDTENIFLFMKSQLCTKLEKRFCDAKAGQTLACFNHLVLCHFSKWCRYIDKKVQLALKKQRNYHFYIHSRKNFDQLNEWVKEMDFSGEGTESDYEAFDASQDSIVLGFEVSLMKYLKFPIEIIESYKFIKFNLRCKLGNFAIMRFTGEFCTFLFNSLCNMAFTFMKYDISKGVAIAFAGDDMVANRRLIISNQFEEIMDSMSLKAKVQFVREPTFCGWKLTQYGIVKSPKLIWERFGVAMERRKVKECLESYMIEACYAYELGDRLFEVLDESDLAFYQLINRFIVKNLNKVSGSIKRKFSKAITQLNGDNSCEQVHQGIQEFWESDGSDSNGLNLP